MRNNIKIIIGTLIMSIPIFGGVDDKAKWNDKFRGKEYIYGKDAVAFVRDNAGLIPKVGVALDIATGEGRNAVFLAEHGLTVIAADISDVALEKAKQLAKDKKVTITTKALDFDHFDSKADQYDVIVATYFLNRELFPKIKKILKEGGLVLFETYCDGHSKYQPRFNPNYLLKKGELREVFADWEILKYREHDTGDSMVESIIARKPKKEN